MIRRLVVLHASMSTRHKRQSQRISYEEAMRYNASQEPSALGYIEAWCFLSLPPLFFNMGTNTGLLAWVLYGLLVCPIVGAITGPTSMPSQIVQGITVCALVNAFLHNFASQGFMLVAYLCLGVGLIVMENW